MTDRQVYLKMWYYLMRVLLLIAGHLTKESVGGHDALNALAIDFHYAHGEIQEVWTEG